MRIRRLELTRYGKFTDHALDFGPAPVDGLDLHVVHGPNEAGKSTAFAAYLDLLYGIESRSRYGFLHPYPTMRIGAELDFGAETRRFARVKKSAPNLLDARDQPIADTAILEHLGGIDRDAYRAMFSLDDETLETGGEGILASRGDLGELLFSASRGLSDLHERLRSLRDEADAFHKRQARNTVLGQAKQRLEELKTQREALDTRARDYKELVDVRDAAALAYEEALGEAAALETQVAELSRLETAWPKLDVVRALRDGLAAFADLPEPPADWTDALPGLREERARLVERVARSDAEMARRTAALDGIVRDDRALALAPRLEAAAEAKARFVTAEKDLPNRRQELATAADALDALLRRLPRRAGSSGSPPILAAALVGRLRDLIERRSGIEVALETARARIEAEDRKLAEAEAAVSRDGGGDPSLRAESSSGLRSAVEAARRSDHAGRLVAGRRGLAEAEDRLAQRLHALAPWRGDVATLAALAVPPAATVARWSADADAARRLLETAEGDVERARRALAEALTEAREIAAATGLVTEGEAADVRAAREAAWAAHLGRLDIDSARAFEREMRRDDQVTAARLGHAGAVAKLARATENRVKATEALATAEAALGRARDTRETHLATIRSATSRLSSDLDAEMGFAALEAWLAARQAALDAGTEHRRFVRDVAEAETDRDRVVERLRAALAAAGDTRDAAYEDEWVARAEETIARAERAAALVGKRDEARREAEQARAAFVAATTRDAAWTDEWRAAVGACWFADALDDPSIPVLREILGVDAALSGALRERDTMAERVAKMEADRAAYRDILDRLAEDLAITTHGRGTRDVAVEIERRVADAREADRRLREAEDALAAARVERDAIDADRTRHDARVGDMARFFTVATLDEVGAALDRVAKRTELVATLAREEAELRRLTGLPTPAEAEARLAALDPTALAADLAEGSAKLRDMQARARELHTRHSNAVDAVDAVGGDAAVALLEEKRRTILLDLQAGALAHLRLRAGVLATERAMGLYRDRHRSAMLAEASRAFAIVTAGAYTKLDAQRDKDGEILVAVPASGGAKSADQLSKGTRFQLYLALRVAGYLEIATKRSPVPFVADDIMETFDDARAAQAFRLLAEMARVGQVIYLTHHRHLCDIARAVAPGVRIHDLTSGPG